MHHRRSTPSPRSVSPRFVDEPDVALSRSSPAFQSGSLRHQQPLVPVSERQFQQQQQQKLVKIFQQPVNNSAVLSSVQPIVQSNGSDTLLSQGSAQQQYVDGGQGSLLRGNPHPQQQSVIHSYQEQETITAAHQLPANLTPTNYSATQSDPSSLSSQMSNKSAGGKRVRVLDASGRDVQVHAGFDGPDRHQERMSLQQSSMLSQSQPGFDGTDLHQERTSVQQSSMSSQSQPVPLAAAQQTSTASTNAYSDLEDIMASMSQFDVCYHKLNILNFVLSGYRILLIYSYV